MSPSKLKQNYPFPPTRSNVSMKCFVTKFDISNVEDVAVLYTHYMGTRSTRVNIVAFERFGAIHNRSAVIFF